MTPEVNHSLFTHIVTSFSQWFGSCTQHECLTENFYFSSWEFLTGYKKILFTAGKVAPVLKEIHWIMPRSVFFFFNVAVVMSHHLNVVLLKCKNASQLMVPVKAIWLKHVRRRQGREKKNPLCCYFCFSWRTHTVNYLSHPGSETAPGGPSPRLVTRGLDEQQQQQHWVAFLPWTWFDLRRVEAQRCGAQSVVFLTEPTRSCFHWARSEKLPNKGCSLPHTHPTTQSLQCVKVHKRGQRAVQQW